MKKLNNKGFTLIEVLAVIVILVVIVSIALPNISAMLDRQSCKTTINRSKLLETNAEKFVSTNRNSISVDGNKKCKITIEKLSREGFITDDDASDSGITMGNRIAVVDAGGTGGIVGDFIVYNNADETYTYCFSSESCKTTESICDSTLTDCISN